MVKTRSTPSSDTNSPPNTPFSIMKKVPTTKSPSAAPAEIPVTPSTSSLPPKSNNDVDNKSKNFKISDSDNNKASTAIIPQGESKLDLMAVYQQCLEKHAEIEKQLENNMNFYDAEITKIHEKFSSFDNFETNVANIEHEQQICNNSINDIKSDLQKKSADIFSINQCNQNQTNSHNDLRQLVDSQKSKTDLVFKTFVSSLDKELSVIKESNDDTARHANDASTKLSTLETTISSHQKFIDFHKNAPTDGQLLQNIDYDQIKEKLTSEIKSSFSPNDTSSTTYPTRYPTSHPRHQIMKSTFQNSPLNTLTFRET